MKLLLSAFLFIIMFIPFTHAQTTLADDMKTLLPEGKHVAKSFLPAQSEPSAFRRSGRQWLTR
jgi:hypothetical protein